MQHFLLEYMLQNDVGIKEHDLKWMKLKQQLQPLAVQHPSPDL